ncbi:hypothetical protein J8J14_16580 [Roseomonas sp. SSH11]|uniref:VanZ-like domain-containing protein n=1 Tax=Pararoseomonas baculiformis TaxID=2820812 RepID=A0ABS4AH73_9PROT|nr:hypothetical protein [Pararoseomonas baculiformis]MBP0446392.1 hypothetical protein [Pararoseomonas baculiformis]
MGLALYALLKNAPFWLPSFLAWYRIIRGGQRARRVALILWPLAVLACFVGPLAEWQPAQAMAVNILLGTVLGALAGFWQRRVQARPSEPSR